MTINNLHKALGILIQNGVEGYSLAAEHDILYICPEEDLPDDANDQLEDLGCHRDENGGWAAFI